jgi:hypothetical protein
MQCRQPGKCIVIEGKHIFILDKPKQINIKINMNTKDNLNIRISEDKQGNVEDTGDVNKCCKSQKDR